MHDTARGYCFIVVIIIILLCLNKGKSISFFNFLRSVVVKSMLTELEKLPGIENVTSQAKFVLPGVQPKAYKRLLERPVCGKI